MKDIFTEEFERHAINHPYLGKPKKGQGGAYLIPCENKKGKFVNLQIVASFGLDWDHVSVSLTNRCPNWFGMDFIKKLFFEPNEVAFQLHVESKNHISTHDYCLHLWRPQKQDIPLPPKLMV